MVEVDTIEPVNVSPCSSAFLILKRRDTTDDTRSDSVGAFSIFESSFEIEADPMQADVRVPFCYPTPILKF